MKYGIEIVKTGTKNEYFGYKENIETGKRKYVCHAFSSERCNQMLDERIASDNT